MVRLSLRRAIHHEYWLRINIQENAPKLIIQDIQRLRDYFFARLTEEEKIIVEKELVARFTHVVTEEERIASIPSKGDTGRRWKYPPKNVKPHDGSCFE